MYASWAICGTQEYTNDKTREWFSDVTEIYGEDAIFHKQRGQNYTRTM